MTHIYVAASRAASRRGPLRCAGLLLAAALLTACTGPGIRPGTDGTGTADHRRWQLGGKLGLRGPQLAESAWLNWRQCGDAYDMRISGPLGQTVARIDGDGRQLTVRMEGQEPVTTAEPEQLLQDRLGWSVPLRALRYWVRAEQAPGPSAEVAGPSGQPTELRQLGWQVSYLEWHRNETVALPARVKLRNEATGLQATLLINEWVLGDAVEGCVR
jgi:outer membrane lipoprotein LolB